MRPQEMSKNPDNEEAWSKAHRRRQGIDGSQAVWKKDFGIAQTQDNRVGLMGQRKTLMPEHAQTEEIEKWKRASIVDERRGNRSLAVTQFLTNWERAPNQRCSRRDDRHDSDSHEKPSDWATPIKQSSMRMNRVTRAVAKLAAELYQ
jgi:hypothetical protein